METEPEGWGEAPEAADAAASARRAARLLGVYLTLLYAVGSGFWAVATASWLEVLENPPPGWRRDDDAWQHQAIVWGNGIAALVALGALAVVLVGRRPVPRATALVALGLVLQLLVFAVMRSGDLP